jgi:heterodisulfide reductase subunit A-like polyferredoxin
MGGRKNVVGSVLVVGGGIGGIQTSLDLANQGYFVYLVEKKLSIGGVMAQLDKTFPTNDCSMCIMSPKLVEAQRHINIEMLTFSEVKSIEGEAGNFSVKVLKHPRFVSIEDCKGCSDCTDVCPVQFPSNYEEGLASRNAIFRPFEQAVPAVFGIDKRGEPPCRTTCPIHVNAQGYIALTSAGEFEKAISVVREKNPFPGITGRICHHPCESSCMRGNVDKPIAIDMIKRFLADNEKKKNQKIPVPQKAKPKSKKVAVVGSGPAGLLCAYDLSLMGYKAVIFEELPIVGGMLSVGIPEYRLPREIIKRETDIIKKLGVEIKLNTKIGKDIPLDNLIRDYDAIFLAIGAHISRKLNIEGEELRGVVRATEFLREINLGKEVKIGEVVTVIGGGNAAIDAARTVLRLGAKRVTIIYRRSIKEMPANLEEIEGAIEEDIKVEFLTNPKRFLGKNGKVIGIECYKMKLGEPDESGRRKPVVIKGSEFVIDTDMVIPAISQEPALDVLGKKELLHSKWKAIDADPVTLETTIKGVFAGGDAVTGPKTYIEAMSAGRKAAISIDRYLSGKDLKENRENEGSYESEIEVDLEGIPFSNRKEPFKIDLDKRKGTFQEVVLGFDEKRAVEEAKRCLNCGGCCECMQCVEACEPDAIIHDMVEEEVDLDVGAIVLTPGFDEYIPDELTEFGYKRFANVVTSTEFERIMCASGPTQGHISRISDSKEPKKIAWIQCIGSRDIKIGHGYCSCVCCMYATKEAVIAKEHAPNIEPTIFYMDMRAYGKDFDKYIDRAKKEIRVRFIRSRVSNIIEEEETKSLILTYENEEGELKKEKFDMVVLSVGLEAPHTSSAIKEKFDIQLDKYNFAKTEPFSPVTSSRKGIFVGGAFSGPKDIPETVAQSSGIASEIGRILKDARWSQTKEKEYMQEKDVSGQPARVGVFICHCGINIGGYVDVPKVVEYTKKLPSVVYAEDNLYTCSADTQERIKDMIREHELNRIVVASCTPRTHESLFRDTVREAGLNKYLFEMANIRDQCSWVHMNDKKGATEKAKDLVRMAVEKSKRLQPLEERKVEIVKSALVIGGGISGMNSALSLAENGFPVTLVENEERLGGEARHIKNLIDGTDVQEKLGELKESVKSNKNITLFLSSNIKEIKGYVGNFETVVNTKNGEKDVRHGVVIVATGAKEYKPSEYLYGKDERVLTQREFEDNLSNPKSEIRNLKSVVMIQCVGSRNDEHPWCSRVCCSTAVKNALAFKKKYPRKDVYILYRDIRTYGLNEDYYQEAREKGIIFIRYEEDNLPKVDKKSNLLTVSVLDPVLKRELEIPADILVLSTGIVPSGKNNEIAEMLKVPLNEDGFFLEAHMKLRPVDFATDGIFLCGLAHSPKSIDECISQAYAASSRAEAILSRDYIEAEGAVAKVDEWLCRACGQCVEACEYNAVELVEKEVSGVEGWSSLKTTVARVNSVMCKGCGACNVVCPTGAISAHHFTTEQIDSMIKAATMKV